MRERKILFAPWRYTYIKGADQVGKGKCVFCQAIKKGPCFESLILWSSKTCSVFLNKYPYNNGHLMVIPHRHTADFEGLTKREFTDLHETLRKSHDLLLKAYGPQGM